MKHRHLLLNFMILHFTLGAVILIQSLQTAVHAVTIRSGAAADVHLAGLAGIEALAASLFLVPRTTRLGGGLLLAILLVAFAVHAFARDLQLGLLVYAAGTLFVMTHGAVSPAGRARSRSTGGPTP